MRDPVAVLERRADDKVKELEKKIICYRRHFHQYPEVAHKERATSEFIAEELEKLGWTVKTNVAGYGIVATMAGGQSCPQDRNRCIAFRADMDALPIVEETGADYASKHIGVMHACGHDNHMAISLGIAEVLSSLRDSWSGTVKLIFEPAEETGEGAPAMIEAGTLVNPRVDAIVNLAVGTSISEGKFRFIEGPAMPRMDTFEIEIAGESSHGGEPDRGVDAIVLAAELIGMFQRIASRQFSPRDGIIVNCYEIQGGKRDSIIPDHVTLTGSVRGFSDATVARAFQLMRTALDGLMASYGGKATMTTENRYPVSVHQPEITRLVTDAAIDVVGRDNVTVEYSPDWGGDSFAYYTAQVPGSFVWLGVRNEDMGYVYPVHHPKFDVRDHILPLAVRVGCRTVFRTLHATDDL